MAHIKALWRRFKRWLGRKLLFDKGDGA